MNSSMLQYFVLIIVSLCVCYEQFNSSVFCIDYSFSLCVLWTVQQFGVLYWLWFLFVCVLWTVQQFSTLYWLEFLFVCVMNSSTVQCFVLTIVSLCVSYESFVLTIVSLCVCYEQFSVFCIDYSFSLCVLWTVQQFNTLYWL